MKLNLLVILGILAVIALLFAGLLPLPGQREGTTPLVAPSPPGTSPKPTSPTGPPHGEPGEALKPVPTPVPEPTPAPAR